MMTRRGRNMVEYRIVKKYGRTFVEARYQGEEWNGWLFLTSTEPRKHWIYIPDLDIWRCNVSAF